MSIPHLSSGCPKIWQTVRAISEKENKIERTTVFAQRPLIGAIHLAYFGTEWILSHLRENMES